MDFEVDDRYLSKLLSYVLRHRPDKAGVALNPQGWVSIDDLLQGLASRSMLITRNDLERVVAENTKQRFAISSDGQYIRANQGHSVEVDLGYLPAMPPAVLYHGTATRNLKAIRASGLNRQGRHYVHLSATIATARQVGSRHGQPVVLSIDSERMYRDGYVFFVTPNGVWLVYSVPSEYLGFPEDTGTSH